MSFYGASPLRRSSVNYRPRTPPLPPPGSDPAPTAPPQLSRVSLRRRRRSASVDSALDRKRDTCPRSSSITCLPPHASMVLGSPAPAYALITPPSSSQVEQPEPACATIEMDTRCAPEPVKTYVPPTWDDTIARIAAFVNRTEADPTEMQMQLSDEIYEDFLSTRETASHGSPLFCLR